MEPRPTTFVLLSTGDRLEVAGALEDVGRILQDAVRSSPGTLAWLQDAHDDDVVGVNPVQVVMMTAAPRVPPFPEPTAGRQSREGRRRT
jgi:hypothetical protein